MSGSQMHIEQINHALLSLPVMPLIRHSGQFFSLLLVYTVLRHPSFWYRSASGKTTRLHASHEILHTEAPEMSCSPIILWLRPQILAGSV